MRKQFICRYLLVPVLIWLSACSTTPVQPLTDEYVVEPADTNSDLPKVRPQANTSPAVLALLGQARQAALAGELERSEAFLERALRIEPRNAVLWHYMAKLRLHQGRYGQAAGLAAKSNSLGKRNPVLQADNWQIIAHARYRMGNAEGAKKAQARADALLNNN